MTDSGLRYRLLDHALERALLGDPVLRAGSLYGAWARERRESRGGVLGRQRRLRALVARMSNSAGQREWIELHCARRGLTNLSVITADVNEFSADARFDRVLSIEMFEPMRNWSALRERVAGWLTPGSGKAFGHVDRPGVPTTRALCAPGWPTLDARADEALEVLRAWGRSEREARRPLGTWRLFLLSTEVIWGYRGGSGWGSATT